MSEQTETLNPEHLSSVRMLLADDSGIVRLAIRRLLNEAPWIDLVGEAESYMQAIEMCAALNPKIMLVDPAEFIKSHFMGCAEHVLAMSIWDDDEARARAESYGAVTLLDKSKLADLLIPTILNLA